MGARIAALCPLQKLMVAAGRRRGTAAAGPAIAAKLVLVPVGDFAVTYPHVQDAMQIVLACLPAQITLGEAAHAVDVHRARQS